ncbi:glycosyltransferase family 31 protein [Hypoxylon trugodes]|uniref:glycosyltransferase family 31 protein n=1 Tax=Hypoxylon trugodes TaxID=326681 RepID=UPI00219D0D43|nr:glycosyltransferase family 31 protein [Hypoxylon trugodes]KAI1383160.1 glycosyltransferase family 31 protein [Hypoxylon trugodes]
MFRSFAPYGRVRTFQILASFLVFCILLSTLRLYKRQPPPPSIYEYTDGKTRGGRQNETGITRPLSEESIYLRQLVQQYGLTNDVPWFARRIRPDFDSKARKSSMTEIPTVKFMPRDFQRVRSDDEHLDLHAEGPVTTPVTKSATPDQLDASSLLFGISTSYDRLLYGNSSLIHDWARWLTDGKGNSNGASLILTLHSALSSEMSHIETKLHDLGIKVAIFPAEDSTARYLDLVRLLVNRKDELLKEGEEKKFLALVDDDVFFSSLGKLLTRLGKFNTKKKAYLGVPSERSDWIIGNNVTLTYGGGAVFLTPPMADSVSQLRCLNATARDTKHQAEKIGQWDEALYTCITENTSEKLHILPSLYVPGDDLYGLRTGYEGGVQPLSLHHYKHRHRFEPNKAHLITSLCGEDCFLQRFFFREDGWILVNGHTISQYPDGVDVLPVTKSSQQLDSSDSKDKKVKTGDRLVFDREDDSEKWLRDRKVVSWAGTKRTWRLLDARLGSDGNSVWQAYVKRKGSPVTYGDEDDRLPEDDTIHTQDGPSDVDSVIVLVWQA